MGFIALRGVEVFGKIGVLPEERLIGRKFLVDIQVIYPLQKASKSDDIADAFNYEILANAVYETFESEFSLLEAACRAMADKILIMHPDIEKIQIRIHKLAPFIHGEITAAEVDWYFPVDY